MNGTSGRLVIISGPSGAGKSTVVQRLLADCQMPIKLSVSATTRRPRQGEVDGVHYHFLSQEDFHEKRLEGQFLECKEVFGRGDWYGTLRGEVATGYAEGKWVLLEIDVEGALAVLEKEPEATTIFLHPGSLKELERRLRHRGTEDDASITRRLEVAGREMASLDRYTYEVINDSVDRAVQEICGILKRSGE